MANEDGAVYINTKINTDGVEGGAEKVEQRIKDMVDKAEKSVKGMADSLKSSSVEGLSLAPNADITQKMKEYGKETKNTSQSTRELGNEAKSAAGGGLSSLSSAIKKIAKLMAGAFAVHKLVSFGKESIALGSDLAEVQNVVDVTFGDLNGEINDFAKNAIKQFGLSETSAKQFSSTMGAMLKSMGFSERQAADMGMSIAGLAGDMASFYNLDAEEAFAKIRSGISGETEPLKQLGINLNVANLEQFALSQGITKSYNAMTQQEQALLRYNYLLNATSGAQGDFARSSDGWANQTRILSEQFNSLKATLGQGLINVLKPLLVSLNQLIGYLQQAADAFLHFTQVLTGADAAEQAVESNGAVAGSFNEITESVEEAEKAQNGYLSGLDEINKYSEPEAASGASSSAGSSGAIQTIVPEVDFSSAEKGSSIFDSIAKKIQGIVKQAKKLASVFSSGFKDGITSVN